MKSILLAGLVTLNVTQVVAQEKRPDERRQTSPTAVPT